MPVQRCRDKGVKVCRVTGCTEKGWKGVSGKRVQECAVRCMQKGVRQMGTVTEGKKHIFKKEGTSTRRI